MVNARDKGQGGEREIADMLSGIIYNVSLSRNPDKLQAAKNASSVQRNQNQSAVGGADLVGTLCFAIEIKRCETLAVSTWWKQCLEQARRNGKIPVLMYRQNRKAWHVVTVAQALGCTTFADMRVEVSIEDFKTIFRRVVEYHIDAGGGFVV